MDIIYGRSPMGGNLGDELNCWLWPKLFGNEIFQKDDQSCLLGIGTMLSDDPVYNAKWINKEKKYIFGTGVRSNSNFITLDKTFKLLFLRGPLSSYFLGLDNAYITDAAYCLNLLPEYEGLRNKVKKYKVGFIPYFRSALQFDWERITNAMGYHLISPITEDNVYEKLEEMAECEYIITEAMHGAILADSLRIPWCRYNLCTYQYEGANVADFKWMDWQYSLDIAQSPYPKIRMTNKINHAVTKLSGKLLNFNYIFKTSLYNRLYEALGNIDKLEFVLSKDEVLSEKVVQLDDAKRRLQKLISL